MFPSLSQVAPESFTFVCGCGNFAGAESFEQAPAALGWAVCRACGLLVPVRLIVVEPPF